MQRNLLLMGVLALAAGFGVAYLAFGAKSKPAVPQAAATVEPPPAIVKVPAKETSATPVSPNAATPTVARPKMMSRQDWKAKDSRGEAREHTPDCITIHHTAVLQNTKLTIDKKLQNLQRFSQSEERLASGKMKPAWFDVPYHFYIANDGNIAEGRPIKYVSDTNTSYDPTRHATIVLEGNFETEQPTEAQQQALQSLVVWLSVQYRVPASRIKAHNDFTATACPGVNLKKLLPALREKVAELTAISSNK